VTARRIRLAALGALAAGCHAADRPPGPDRDAARTAVVRPGQITERVLLTGALHPTRAIDVPVPASDATTLVLRWIAPDGAAVDAGDRLFALDGAGLAGKLVDARHQLATAQAQLRVLLRNNAVELANRQLAVRDAEVGADKAHLRDGLPGDLVTRRDAEQARLRVTQTEAALQTAQRELASETEQRTLDERLKRLELERSRRAALAAAAAIDAQVVRAPRDGMVLINSQPSGDGHKFRVGDQVSSGMPVVSLPDLSRPMEVRALLSDVDDGLVAVHMAGRCTLDAYPDQPVERSETGGGDPDGFAGGAGGKAPRGIDCSVEQLAPVARPSPGRDPLRRAFEVTLALAHGDPARLHPGMSVKVELDRPAVRGLIVPRGAVIPGAPARVRLGSGELREIVLGGCDAQRCAVASGLTDGELVAGGAS
jgi:multidrug efflux pump subunit AcrA (membrane-fusion protein)